VPAVTLFSPAKINLFLAVVGRRVDGFHDLLSVAAPLAWGDTLIAETNTKQRVELECDDPSLPTDESNLVVRAANLFRERTGWSSGLSFSLQKRIPQGAGLGGGSSNASTALLALNRLAGLPLQPIELAELAARLGSDCPLFLEDGPVVMRGRGERLEPLPTGAVSRLRGRRLLVFKPSFGVPTPWAYRRLAESRPSRYLPSDEAEARLAHWIANPRLPVEDLLYNTFETVAFEKFVALPTLLEILSTRFDLKGSMSGSGSACFAFLPERRDPDREDAIRKAIREAWGDDCFLVETAHR